MLVSSPQRNALAIASLSLSALSSANTVTTLFYDFDTDVSFRRKEPKMWGAIPDVGRGLVYALMVLLSTFQMTVKVFSISLLACTDTRWLGLWLSLDMLLYLGYKLLRRDFVYCLSARAHRSTSRRSLGGSSRKY